MDGVNTELRHLKGPKKDPKKDPNFYLKELTLTGRSSLSYLCTILMGHSDIIKVIVFFKSSQSTFT